MSPRIGANGRIKLVSSVVIPANLAQGEQMRIETAVFLDEQSMYSFALARALLVQNGYLCQVFLLEISLETSTIRLIRLSSVLSE